MLSYSLISYSIQISFIQLYPISFNSPWRIFTLVELFHILYQTPEVVQKHSIHSLLAAPLKPHLPRFRRNWRIPAVLRPSYAPWDSRKGSASNVVWPRCSCSRSSLGCRGSEYDSQCVYPFSIRCSGLVIVNTGPCIVVTRPWAPYDAVVQHGLDNAGKIYPDPQLEGSTRSVAKSNREVVPGAACALVDFDGQIGVVANVSPNVSATMHLAVHLVGYLNAEYDGTRYLPRSQPFYLSLGLGDG